MNILIIGNGFDLAHGLPTTYNDFLGFIEYFNLIYNNSEKNITRYKSSEGFKNLHIEVQNYLLSEKVLRKNHVLMNELYNLSIDNIWINHLTKCSKANKLRGQNWIDFESEITKVIMSLECLKDCNKATKRLDTKISVDEELRMNGAQLLDSIKKSLQSRQTNQLTFDNKEFCDENAKIIIKELDKDLNNLIRCLEIYLDDIVGNIEVNTKLPDIEKIDKIDKLLSFNYTHTFENIYDTDNKVEYDYVHGTSEKGRTIEMNNMVLGIDEYLYEEDKNKKLDFIQFKKYFQRIYKKTGCIYKHWLEKQEYEQSIPEVRTFESEEEPFFTNNMYFYGHSLDITDKDILQELILFPKTQITIFYYSNSDYVQKISNLVGLIGQDYLIDNIYGSNPKIIFKQINE